MHAHNTHSQSIEWKRGLVVCLPQHTHAQTHMTCMKNTHTGKHSYTHHAPSRMRGLAWVYANDSPQSPRWKIFSLFIQLTIRMFIYFTLYTVMTNNVLTNPGLSDLHRDLRQCVKHALDSRLLKSSCLLYGHGSERQGNRFILQSKLYG
jgi:hypothetical protein